jgi:hypothetical protein
MKARGVKRLPALFVASTLCKGSEGFYSLFVSLRGKPYGVRKESFLSFYGPSGFRDIRSRLPVKVSLTRLGGND